MQKPPLKVWALILGGLAIAGLLAYAPIGIPGVDSIVFYKLFWAGVYAHVIEAIIVAVMAQRAGAPVLPWFGQTLALGGASMQAFLASQGSDKKVLPMAVGGFLAIFAVLWFV